ncbi:hypothetical protein MJH54_34175, partial [Salmonella enterica subsp. enterica serovar Montevideo]|nr:hypothetical protein [Salmonella enterica subsp. enterica serovar Montevideo]
RSPPCEPWSERRVINVLTDKNPVEMKTRRGFFIHIDKGIRLPMKYAHFAPDHLEQAVTLNPLSLYVGDNMAAEVA